MELPVSKSFPYEEPSSLDEIKKTRPISKRKYTLNYNDVELFDRIYGAWLGRTAGCALGKPVEGWSKDQIDKYLVETNLDSLKNYFPFNERVRAHPLMDGPQEDHYPRTGIFVE